PEEAPGDTSTPGEQPQEFRDCDTRGSRVPPGGVNAQGMWRVIDVLRAELARERELSAKFRKWANCGGVQTGRNCIVDGHAIYGPYRTNDKDEAICECHSLHAAERELSAARESLAQREAEL